MNEDKHNEMIQSLMKDDSQYLKGTENIFIRAYFYCSNGLTILNEFRNMFLGIIAVYIALKWDNYWLLIAMVIPSIIIMTVIGYWVVHRVGKVREWLSLRFSTHFGIRSFNYQEESYKLLVEIRDLLKK